MTVDFQGEPLPDANERLGNRAAQIAAEICSGDIVLVAGQARAGKSTFSRLLRQAVQSRGLGAIIVPLDSWIMSHSDRRPELGFRGRHDFSAATTFILGLRGCGGCFALPEYDRASRTRVEGALTIDKRPEDVMIVEGVSALLNQDLEDLARIRVFVRAREAGRRDRMIADYRKRGLGGPEIESLLNERSQDEFPLVEASAARATVIIDEI